MNREPSIDDNRAQGILRELLRSGKITVEEMAQKFGVSPSSIRRDLRDLERQGLLGVSTAAQLPLNHRSTSLSDMSLHLANRNNSVQRKRGGLDLQQLK